jgi:hypothetical protein
LGNDDGGGDETATPLAKGVILSAQSGNPGTSALYAIDVPAGATVLNIRTIGRTGDVSLYVKVGSAPAADGSDANYKSTRPGNNEAVVIATPQARRVLPPSIGRADRFRQRIRAGGLQAVIVSSSATLQGTPAHRRGFFLETLDWPYHKI